MNLDYSEDQVALADLVRSICDDHCPTGVVRAMEDDRVGYPTELWEQLRQAGLLGTLIPEEFGGNPVSMLDNAAIYEQFGRALAPVPHFVSSVVSALALVRCEAPAGNALLPAIAAGGTIVTAAWLEPHNGFAAAGVQLTASPDGSGYRLDGNKRHVFFAAAANRLLVLARTGARDTDVDLFLVDAGADGITLTQEFSMASDTQFLVRFDGVTVAAGARLTDGGSGWALWNDVMQEAIILDAARAVGLTERALEITVDYAKQREQFDKPIAAFQSISHYLADCATTVEGAKTLMYEAAWAHSHGKPYEVLAAMAKLFAYDTARSVTAKAEQIHGGIGFTLEYDIQLFFRRAKQQQINWWDARHLEALIEAAIFDNNSPIAAADPFIGLRRTAGD